MAVRETMYVSQPPSTTDCLVSKSKLFGICISIKIPTILKLKLSSQYMAQAPPTPPPMSATELRDEARDSIIASSTGSSDPTTSPNSSGSLEPSPQLSAVQDIYQQVFPQLSDLAEQRNYIGIINIAEHHDLNVSTS